MLGFVVFKPGITFQCYCQVTVTRQQQFDFTSGEFFVLND